VRKQDEGVLGCHMGLVVGLLLGYAWAPVACSGKSSSSLYFLFSFLFLILFFNSNLNPVYILQVPYDVNM
jgi:hypothetical protein